MTASTPQFVYEVNGSSISNLVDAPRSYEHTLRRLLSLMREPDRSTFSLAQLPEGQTIHDVTRETFPSTFLQAAGTADAMTIEWRRRDDDGIERLYTLGREDTHTGEPDTAIEFFGGTRSTSVYADEVFATDEAGDVFFHYFQTSAVPPSYALREFDLTWPKP
jgi:hypothetical protein